MTGDERSMGEPAVGGVELERGLEDLGRALRPIEAPELAAAVRARIEAGGELVPGRGRRFGWRSPGLDGLRLGGPMRRAIALALVALVVLAGVAAALRFGLPGLRFVVIDATPVPGVSASARPSPTIPPLDELDLGVRVSPSDLAGAAGYEPRLPALADLGEPIATFVRGAPPRAQVSAVYPASTAFPGRAGEPAAILVTQFPATLHADVLEKGLFSGTIVEAVVGDELRGYWITGRPHEVWHVGPDGRPEADSVRLAGNVLAWTDGVLTFRIEGARDLESALRIAASMG